MKLLDKLFEVGNPPRRCLAWSVVVVLVFVVSCLLVRRGYDSELPWIKLERPASFKLYAAGDTLAVSVARGDSVKILGIRRYAHTQRYLVELSGGMRGFVEPFHLPVKQLMVSGIHKGDTAEIKSAKYLGGNSGYVMSYLMKNIGGEEYESGAENFEPLIEGWSDIVLDDDYVYGCGSTGKIEKMLQNASLADAERSLGAPSELLRYPDGSIVARFPFKAFDGSNGRFYNPLVEFARDSTVSKVCFLPFSSRNSMLLKHAPLASGIFDSGLADLVLSRSAYTPVLSSSALRGLVKAGLIVFAIIFCMGALVWIYCTSSLPVLLMGWLVIYPKVYAKLGDRTLKTAMFVVAAVSFYYWAVLMLGWGMWGVLLVASFLVARYFFQMSTCLLCRYPHARCPICRNLHTLELDSSELVDSEEMLGSEVVEGRLLGTSKKRWQSWTEVRWTRSDEFGNVYSGTSKENVVNHTTVMKEYEMIDYEVRYRVDSCLNAYVCSYCEYEEQTENKTVTRMSRREVGRHRDTSSYDV